MATITDRVSQLKDEREQVDALYNQHQADFSPVVLGLVNRLFDLNNHALTAALEGADLGAVAAAATAGALSGKRVTIEIPSGFGEMFCFAAAIEIESDAEWVHGMSKELRKRVTEAFDRHGPDPAKPVESRDLEEVLGSGAYLPKAVAIGVQAFAGKETIEGEPDVLAHVLEGLARWVVPALIEQIPGPLDGPESRAPFTEVVEALDWSAREAARLYEIDRGEES